MQTNKTPPRSSTESQAQLFCCSLEEISFQGWPRTQNGKWELKKVPSWVECGTGGSGHRCFWCGSRSKLLQWLSHSHENIITHRTGHNSSSSYLIVSFFWSIFLPHVVRNFLLNCYYFQKNMPQKNSLKCRDHDFYFPSNIWSLSPVERAPQSVVNAHEEGVHCGISVTADTQSTQADGVNRLSEVSPPRTGQEHPQGFSGEPIMGHFFPHTTSHNSDVAVH